MTDMKTFDAVQADIKSVLSEKPHLMAASPSEYLNLMRDKLSRLRELHIRRIAIEIANGTDFTIPHKAGYARDCYESAMRLSICK